MPGERTSAALFVLFQIWLAGNLGGSLPAILLLALAVIMAMSTRLRFAFQPRWKLAALIGAGVLLAVLARMNAHASEAEDFLAWRAVSMGIAMFCMGYQVCELWERKAEHKLSGYLVAFGIAAIVCLFSQATMNRPALAISSAIMAVFLAAIQFDFSAGKAWSLVSHPFAPRSLVIYAVLAGVAITTGYIDEFFLRNVPRFQSWLESTVRVNAGHTAPVRSYVRSATLSSVAFEKRTDPYAQALMVDCEKLPGYLRGAAYDSFDGISWGRRRVYADADLSSSIRVIPQAKDQSELPADLKPDTATRVFPVHRDATGPWLRVEISNDPRRGEMFFAPLEADHVQIPGGRLLMDELDVVRGKIDTKLPYTFFVGENEPVTELTSEQKERLLRVPEALEQRFQPLLPQVFSATANTTSQKIAEVEKYFNDKTKFKYSIDGFELPKNVGPLIHFMEKHPPAHCEFFASGAALLLRMKGVPCRYVTGYVVIAATWGDTTKWVARNRDAHAWVEAYDAEAKTWRIVEATPEVNVPKSLKIKALNEQKAGGTAGQNVTTQIDDNIWNIKMLWSFLRAATLDHLLMNLSLTVLIAGLAWYLWQRLRAGRAPSVTARERKKLHAILLHLDGRLRRHKLHRERVETLHQFAQRIRTLPSDDPWLQRAADWYLEYAHVVYGRSADLQSLRELATRVP